ncbi:MAG: type II toxin-antitoxin system RelE/ParE family toxin [Acidobacteriales bacterium]|nr:type II toxin-antitoxin system RelE/ParE family toxin [Terriglobales bacterium]
MYQLGFKPNALRDFEKLPRAAQRRIAAKLEGLREQPFPPGCKKLEGMRDTWRIRAGDYRVVYQVHQGVLLILVVAVGHRREIYR